MTTDTDVTHKLRTLLPADRLIRDPIALQRYSQDAFRPSRAHGERVQQRATPIAIVRPRTTAEVMAVVRFAATHRVPLVPYGGGTGLMGGALSIQPGLVVDLGAMDRILRISSEDLQATVQPGVLLKDLHDALAAQGLLLGHDPWSLPIATIGGALSTNGLGYRGGRYGAMGDQVLGLEVVLGDGRTIRTKAVPKTSVGPDLTRLFIGAEGTLGIITEVTLEVYQQPEATWRRAYVFDSFEAGYRALQTIWSTGLRPALLDYGDRFAVPGLDWGQDEPPLLYIGFEGFAEEVEAAAQRTAAICASARDLGKAEAEHFWQNRHQAALRFQERRAKSEGEQVSWLSPGSRFEFIHVALPPSRVLEYRTRAFELLGQRGAYITESGVWTRPELFSLGVVKPHCTEEEAHPFAAAIDEALMLAQDLGGAMEYVHGVGTALAHLMEREHGQDGLALLQQIKNTCDPQHILNPGKLGLRPA